MPAESSGRCKLTNDTNVWLRENGSLESSIKGFQAVLEVFFHRGLGVQELCVGTCQKPFLRGVCFKDDCQNCHLSKTRKVWEIHGDPSGPNSSEGQLSSGFGLRLRNLRLLPEAFRVPWASKGMVCDAMAETRRCQGGTWWLHGPETTQHCRPCCAPGCFFFPFSPQMFLLISQAGWEIPNESSLHQPAKYCSPLPNFLAQLHGLSNLEQPAGSQGRREKVPS